jgi:hypothetical protein
MPMTHNWFICGVLDILYVLLVLIFLHYFLNVLIYLLCVQALTKCHTFDPVYWLEIQPNLFLKLIY